ncbi:aldo/keto reductase [Brevibacterium atlanticum]|uniref:aldo/keto reductase n=1 Tax=Brevibacterium atlanticum TaxID=2697563 RepID=UPI00141E6B59|nr:aldo/keto reductase [Brevibacterium atlanticum]
MTILNDTLTLSNEVAIPRLGLGTWFIDDDQAAQAVRDAIEVGYRNIDTAQAYGNERGVGEGVRTSGIARDDLFVSTKLAAEIKDYEAAVAAIDESLSTIGLDYIDLMLIHAPQPWDDFREGDYAEGNRQAWKALEEAHRAGRIRAIGVSNFLIGDLDDLIEHASVAPHVNQILAHVGNTPSELIAHCREHGIVVEAYSPIAHGAVLDSPDITAMADRYGVSVPQLCIRYTLQLGAVSLPKTANPDHMRSNADVDFVISDHDMETLRGLGQVDYGEFAAFPVFSGK